MYKVSLYFYITNYKTVCILQNKLHIKRISTEISSSLGKEIKSLKLKLTLNWKNIEKKNRKDEIKLTFRYNNNKYSALIA